MLFIISIIFVVFVLFFGYAILFGAPYLPTLKPQCQSALELLDLKPGQTIIDLGCGDGRVLKTAAKSGLKGIGYEINPILFLIAKLNTFQYRKSIKIIWGNYWNKPWPKTDAIFVFLLDKYMSQLNHRINKYEHKPVALVSFAFKIPDKVPDKESNGIYLYKFN